MFQRYIRNAQGIAKQPVLMARKNHVTVHFMQAYTGTSAMMSSVADLSFITTSVTTTKSKLYFHFNSGVPSKKNKNNNPFLPPPPVLIPVDPLLPLVFQRRLVVIFLGIYQCCHNSDNSLSQTILQSRCNNKKCCGTPCAKLGNTYWLLFLSSLSQVSCQNVTPTQKED